MARNGGMEAVSRMGVRLDGRLGVCPFLYLFG